MRAVSLLPSATRSFSRCGASRRVSRVHCAITCLLGGQVLAIQGMREKVAALCDDAVASTPADAAGSQDAGGVSAVPLDEDVEVVFLGTSSAVPHKYRNGAPACPPPLSAPSPVTAVATSSAVRLTKARLRQLRCFRCGGRCSERHPASTRTEQRDAAGLRRGHVRTDGAPVRRRARWRRQGKSHALAPHDDAVLQQPLQLR